MLRALTRWVMRVVDDAQLAFPLETTPRSADELLGRLRALGLEGIDRCQLTRNRSVMVSFRCGTLRVHECYLAAPADAHEAVVRFVMARSRRERRAAERVVLAFAPTSLASTPARARSRERLRPEDEGLATRLSSWHRTFNERYFDGTLRAIPVRVSRRMRSRLGHYTPMSAPGGAEIAISRRHLRRHGWTETLHTLLHEMVHQWQDEAGHPIDHGHTFRAKAHDVGVTPRARRPLAR